MKLIGLVLLVALTAVLVVGDILFAGRNEPNVIPVPVLTLVGETLPAEYPTVSICHE